MMKKPTLAQRLRYAFENTLSRGPASLILWLIFATAALIALAFVLDLIVGGVSQETGLGPREIFWNILFQALVPNPPGNFAIEARQRQRLFEALAPAVLVWREHAE